MHKKLSVLAAAVLAVAAAGTASAHTISIGVYNAGGPGSVTLAMGTYGPGHSAGPIFQGAMALIAGPSTTGPVAFTSVALIKPGALVDGVNNFYANAVGFGNNLPSDSFTSPTNTVGVGSVAHWQEVTFAGLTAGNYTYQLSGMTSVNWVNINSNQNNWTGTIVISGVTAGVPEPGSLALAGLALVGLVAAGRRRRPA